MVRREKKSWEAVDVPGTTSATLGFGKFLTKGNCKINVRSDWYTASDMPQAVASDTGRMLDGVSFSTSGHVAN